MSTKKRSSGDTQGGHTDLDSDDKKRQRLLDHAKYGRWEEVENMLAKDQGNLSFLRGQEDDSGGSGTVNHASKALAQALQSGPIYCPSAFVVRVLIQTAVDELAETKENLGVKAQEKEEGGGEGPDPGLEAHRQMGYPFHWFLRKNWFDGEKGMVVVQLFLEFFPRLPFQMGGGPNRAGGSQINGFLPVHLAILNFRGSKSVARYLLERFPETAELPTNQGDYLLDLAFGNGDSAGAALYLLEQFPHMASARCRGGATPLHRACLKAPKLCSEIVPVVTKLLQLAPDSAKIQDDEGNLPVHLAILNYQGSKSVAHHLLQHFPETAELPTSKGNLLHLACGDGGSTEAALYLLEQFPHMASARGRGGATPLHFASSAADVPVVTKLLQLAPDNAKIQDDEGNLPLHLLAQSVSLGLVNITPSSSQVMDLLLQQYPVGAWVKSGDLAELGFEEVYPLQIILQSLAERVEDGSGSTEEIHVVWNGLDQPIPTFPFATEALLRANPAAVGMSNFFSLVCYPSNPGTSEWGYWDDYDSDDDDEGDEDPRPFDEATIQHRRNAMLQLAIPDNGTPATVRVPVLTNNKDGVGGAFQVTGEEERSLLHIMAPLASRYKDMPMVLSRAAELFPESLEQPDTTQRGRLPLHLLLNGTLLDEPTFVTFLEVVDKFLNLCPKSAASLDNTGFYPFLLAASNGCDLSVIYHVLRHQPDVLEKQFSPVVETAE